MNSQQYIEQILSLKRDAFVPRVEPQGFSPDIGSRYFGNPWMPDGMDWPSDGGKPMNFVLQLDLKTAPWRAAGMPETGLLLFFHAEEYNDPEDQSFIAVVDPSLPGGLRTAPAGCHVSGAMPIVSWTRTVDVPDGESILSLPEIAATDELDDELRKYGYTQSASGDLLLIVEGGLTYEDEITLVEDGAIPFAHTFRGDKIGGWPAWEQGDDTPEEADGTKWTYFMQVGYEGLRQRGIDEINPTWPTWGIGHIYFREGKFLYVWACD